ncbi:MAG: hypothetical protein ABWY54_07825 [Glaciihabitans sp.]
MSRLFRKAMRGLFKAATSPLTLSQGFSSLAGAFAMVIAVVSMQTSGFAMFALISLAGTVTVGLGRASLFQPALIHQRTDKNAVVPLKYAVLAGTGAAVMMGSAGWLFGVRSAGELCLLATTGALPVLLDWLRFRRIAIDDRWAVAWADALRLATVLCAFPVSALSENPVLFQSYLQAACVIPLALLLIGHRRARTYVPFARYRHAAGYQVSDFLIGQANSTLPLLLLGGLGTSALLSGVRFAQTIFGPLNLIASASVMHLMADGATRSTHKEDSHLVRTGKSLSWRLGATSFSYVMITLAILLLPGVKVSGIEDASLRTGVLLVGSVAIVSGWAGIHSIILRLLGKEMIATAARTVLVTITLCVFLVGYIIGGVDLSLTLGFMSSAVLYPLVFVLPAQFVYRRLLDGGSGGEIA